MYIGIQQLQGFPQPAFSNRLNLHQDTEYNYIDNRASMKTLLSSCRILQRREINKLYNRIYQLLQHQAQWAIQPFNLAFQQSQFNNKPKIVDACRIYEYKHIMFV
ncbi:MAG: hypothetical protein EZS28_028520 [Streblomastix strix]|uniref:Uncharacterized protein n=1 Tax=Streblomastix strix TaxID=222440 RepID=A0A5J4V0A3_9EUKA|nr:MAG: hypothetical protein EZS28_028520 [Streblomastix strix]